MFRAVRKLSQNSTSSFLKYWTEEIVRSDCGICFGSHRIHSKLSRESFAALTVRAMVLVMVDLKQREYHQQICLRREHNNGFKTFDNVFKSGKIFRNSQVNIGWNENVQALT